MAVERWLCRGLIERERESAAAAIGKVPPHSHTEKYARAHTHTHTHTQIKRVRDRVRKRCSRCWKCCTFTIAHTHVQDSAGKAPLHYAVEKKDGASLTALLSAKANPDVQVFASISLSLSLCVCMPEYFALPWSFPKERLPPFRCGGHQRRPYIFRWRLLCAEWQHNPIQPPLLVPYPQPHSEKKRN